MASSSSSSPEISAAPARHSPDQSAHKYSTIDEVLEDLSSRFILNLPDEELASLERVCFQVEQAHWFYEDFIREENPKFPSLPLKRFSALLFHACPLLRQWSHDHEQAFNNFMQYKTRVPVCGAIMLNDTWEKCILVKGWKSSSGWGFPKGKINQDEEPHKCAVREVLEETGYDLSGKIDPEDVIEMSIREQKISLYIVPGIPEDYPFKTRTRKEISRIEWFKLTDLPTWRRNKAVPGKFYLISPFIGPLKAFINERRPRTGRKPARMKDPSAASRIEEGVDLTLDLHSHISISHTHNTQESSSSSSVDNGGPDTPSPQWSEPAATQVVVNGNDEAPSSALDPDLARLLTALSLSAANGTTFTTKNEGPAITSTKGTEALSSTPVPAVASSVDPVLASSSSVPSQTYYLDHSGEPTSGASRPLGEYSPQSLELPSSSVAESAPHAVPVVASHSEHAICDQADGLSNTSQVSTSPPPTAVSATSAAAPSTTSSSRPAVARRGSGATADISPYLSRPSEIPSSGKRLKQLALLETVADESARMTPVLMHRNLVTPTSALDGRMSVAPSSPMSATSHGHPSNTLYASPRDPRVIYSSGAQALPSPSFTPLPAGSSLGVPHPHAAMPYDPFRVRSQTSMSFHPAPPTHHYRAAGRSSMHEKQLLAALNGPVGGNSSHPSQHVAPLRPAYGAYPSGSATPSKFLHSAQSMENFNHPRVSNVLPPMQPPAPYAPRGPSDAMGFTAPRSSVPPDNAHLLSILNSHGPMRVQPPAVAIPPPGVINTIGSR